MTGDLIFATLAALITFSLMVLLLVCFRPDDYTWRGPRKK